MYAITDNNTDDHIKINLKNDIRNIQNIFEQISLGYGYYVRKVFLSKNQLIYDDKLFDIDNVLVGKAYKLFDVNTIKYFVDRGTNIHDSFNYLIKAISQLVN